MTITLYSDETYELKGILRSNNEAFQRKGHYTILNDSYHDEVQRAVVVRALAGYIISSKFGRSEEIENNQDFCITGSLEMYRSPAIAANLFHAKRDNSYFEGRL